MQTPIIPPLPLPLPITHALPLALLLALTACDDTSQPTGEAAGAQAGAGDLTPAGAEAPISGTALPAGVEPPLGATPAPAGATPPLGAATPPPTSCEFDDQCPEGLYCFAAQGRCVPERPCDPSGACPDGLLCVGGLCYDGGGPSGGATAPASALAFEPERLRLTYSAVGERQQSAAQLVNLGDAPLTLERVAVEGSATFALSNPVMTPQRLSPNAPIQIDLTYTPDDDRPDSAQLVAYTTEGVTATLSMVGESKMAGGGPCLTVAPRQVFFGTVPRGQTAARDVTLTSCGTQAVRVLDVRRGSSLFGSLPATFNFSAPPRATSIPPGQSINMPVTYSPQRAGLEAGFLEVLSDDPREPTQRVDLSAIAEPPPLQDIALHVRLAWDTDLTDVDLHLLGPNGQVWTCEGDCYFSNGNPNWADQSIFQDDPFLDLDDVDGYGPENINLETPAPGVYKVWVHYWASHGGESPDATIQILRFGQEIASFGPRRLSNVDDMWEVAQISIPDYMITPINTLGNYGRGPLCGGF
jgi:hypothetical protein